jgi:hypothetical protein
MPMFGTPVLASRPGPVRTARIPEAVKHAITTMVEEGEDFISAGKRHGVTAQMMRRWLGRAEAISFLRATRSRFRLSACAQNEATLVQIRDARDGNQMARCKAVQILEQLDETPMHRPGELSTSRGIVLNIISAPQPAPIVDITPEPRQIIDASDEQ